MDFGLLQIAQWCEQAIRTVDVSERLIPWPTPSSTKFSDQLELTIADEDETVERAKESLEATLASLKLTPEEESALWPTSSPSCATSAEKLDEHDRDRRLRHGQPGQVVGPECAHGPGRLPGRRDPRHDRPRAAQRWQHDAAGRPGLEGAQLVVSTHRASTRSAARSARPWPAKSPGMAT